MRHLNFVQIEFLYICHKNVKHLKFQCYGETTRLVG